MASGKPPEDDWEDVPNDDWQDVPDSAAAPSPAAAPAANAAPAVPLGESIARGGLQGASFGLSDDLAAVPMALMHGDPLLGVTLDEPNLADRYTHALHILQQKNHEAHDANPRAYRGSEIGGGFLAPGSLAASRAASLPGIFERMWSLAKSGMQAGALSGLGYSESDDPMEQIGSAALGGAVGAATTPLVSEGIRQAATRALLPIAEGLTRAAGSKLFNIAGGIKGDVRAVGGPERAIETGLKGRDEGLVKWWDFLPGAGARQAERVENYGEAAQKKIGEAIDDVGARVKVAPLVSAIDQVASRIRDFAEVNPSALDKVEGLIAALNRHGAQSSDGTVSARTLQSAKTAIDDLITTWDPSGKSRLAAEVKKGLYGALAGAQEEAVASSPFSSAPGLAKYQEGKAASQLAMNLEKLQASKQARGFNVLGHVGGLPGVMGGIAALARGIESGQASPAFKIALLTQILASPRTHAAAELGGAAALNLPSELAQSGVTPVATRSLMSALVGDKAQSGELADAALRDVPTNYGIGTIEEYLAQRARERGGLGIASEPSMALR